jgi:cell division protein FtsQ
VTVTARIEPRLRARRVAVLREQGRRRLRVMVTLAGLLALAAAAWLIVQSPLLDVEHVGVSGTRDLTEADVRGAAGVAVGDALLLVDTGDVERRVEAVPGVVEAHVRRHLPDGVRISIVERPPVAWARRAPDRIALVDGSGRVVSNVAEPPAGMPELTGVTRLPPAGGVIAPATGASVLERIPGALRVRTTGVLLAEGQATLRLDDGVEVRLGAPRAVGEKGRTALAVLAAAAGQPIAYVDVRVPASPVTG